MTSKGKNTNQINASRDPAPPDSSSNKTATKKYRQNSNSSLVFAGLLLLLLVIALPISLFLSRQERDERAGAATGDAVVNVNEVTLGPGQSGTLTLDVLPNGESVSGVQVVGSYDPNLFSITGFEQGNFFDRATQGDVFEFFPSNDRDQVVDEAAGTVFYANYLLSQDGGVTQDGTLIEFNVVNNNDFEVVATLNLLDSPPAANSDFQTNSKVLTSSGDNVLDKVVTVAAVEDTNTGDNSNNSGTPDSVDTTADAVCSPSARLYFVSPVLVADFSGAQADNSQATIQPGDSFKVMALLDTGEQDGEFVEVSGVDAHINLPDPSVATLEEIDTSDTLFNLQSRIDQQDQNRVILGLDIGAEANTSSISGNRIELMSMRFKAQSPGSTEMSYVLEELCSRNDSNVAKLVESGQEPVDILQSQESQTIVVLEDGSGPELVDVRLQFFRQGRRRAGVDKGGVYTVTYNQLSADREAVVDSATVELPADQTGTTELVSLPVGSHVLLVDYPGYLVQSYGTAENPLVLDSSSTGATIQLHGDNQDLPLLGGDYNGDTEINGADYGILLRSFLSDNTFEDQNGDTVVLDLDGSGQVNSLEYAIMRSNWGESDKSFNLGN